MDNSQPTAICQQLTVCQQLLLLSNRRHVELSIAPSAVSTHAEKLLFSQEQPNLLATCSNPTITDSLKKIIPTVTNTYINIL